MPYCTNKVVHIGKVVRRVIQAAFDGGDLVSDSGVLLMRQVDRFPGLTDAVARVFGNDGRRASVIHGVRHLLAQRIYGLCCGWDDVRDHNTPRHDLAFGPIHCMSYAATHRARTRHRRYAHTAAWSPGEGVFPSLLRQSLLPVVVRVLRSGHGGVRVAPSSRDPASVLSALIKPLARRLRQASPT